MNFITLTVVRISITVVLKDPFLGWQNKYEGRLKSSWTRSSAPLLKQREAVNLMPNCSGGGG
jgi:hypothetical protein